MDKIIEKDQLAHTVNRLKKQGKKIVTTNGVFDILHPGHTDYLAHARSLGDVLIVAVNSDSSVRKLKGPKRPVNKAKDRARVLAALRSVDYCTIFDEIDPRSILEIIKPHIHVKGGDYSPRQLIEREIVEKNGGKVILAPADKKYSTSNVIRKVLSKHRC